MNPPLFRRGTLQIVLFLDDRKSGIKLPHSKRWPAQELGTSYVFAAPVLPPGRQGKREPGRPAEILNLQAHSGKCKPYQVKQVRNVRINYRLAGEADV